MSATERQFGKYRLLKKIATGGMGEIFVARHVDQPEKKPPVALKRILKHRSKDKRFVRMFFKEAKIISDLDHENLIKVEDFGKEQDQFYMTMEYVDGYNLDTLWSLSQQSPGDFPMAARIEIVRQALEGMAYAHQRSDTDGKALDIVHLDLSTHNLMVDRSGTVKVLDFGISKAIYDDDQKAYNALRGTYAYMSPEQCREEAVDERSDLFTLGIVLYELTTLRPLFSRQPSEFMILKAITEGTIPPPSNAIKDFPPELELVIYKALKVDRDERYQSADDFIEALAGVVAEYNYPSGKAMLSEAINRLIPDSEHPQPDATQAADTTTSSGVEDEKTDTDGAQNTDTAKQTQETAAKEKPGEVESEDSEPAEAAKPQLSRKQKKKQAASLAKAKIIDEPPRRRRRDRQEIQTARRTDAPETEDPPDDLPEPDAAIAAADWEEQSLKQRGQKRLIWSAFIILLGMLIGTAVFTHYRMTGWLQPNEGATVYMPQTGTLYVASEPEGAQVFVDKLVQPGKTPMHVRDLPFGKEITIEVVPQKGESIMRSITLTAQKPLAGIAIKTN